MRTAYGKIPSVSSRHKYVSDNLRENMNHTLNLDRKYGLRNRGDI